MNRTRATLLFVALALGLLGPGCNSTETGNPPATSGIDLGQVDVVPPPMPEDGGPMPAPGPTRLEGGPGSVDEAARRVLAVPLDTDSPMLEAVPEADGSFLIVVPPFDEGELRMQVDEGSRRRPPIDVRPVGLRLIETAHPIGECLEVPLELLLDTASSTASLTIKNSCSSAITFDPPEARTGGLSFSQPAFTVDPGQEHSFDVGLSSGAEDVLLITATSPSGDRRPVTVRVRGSGE